MAKHLNRAAPSSTTSNISDQALTPDEPRVSTKSAGTARSTLPATADSSDARPIRRLPAYRTWVPALLIWILSCAVHFGIFALSLSRDLQHPMSKVNRSLDYLSYLNIWDALFYERIYKHGYPQELPFLPDGTVNHNTWAFMPLQSVLSGGVSNVFGIDYRLASVLVTLVAGCALSLVLYRLFVGSLNWSARGVFDTRPQAGDESRNRLALWALAVYALSPASPIFVTGYAEALSTLFLALCTWCVVRNRYLLLLPVALCAALSRPVGVPLGAFVGLWWLWCTVADYRDRTGGILRLSLSDAWAAFRGRLGQLLSALVVCSFAFVHPLHAALRTGRPDAYLATELGWSGRKPEEGHLIFIQWVKQWDEYLGGSLPWEIVALFFVALILGFYWWISLKGNRSLLHPALWLWTACYAGYLFIFWLPITSTPRIILPMFTLSLLVASYLPKSRVYRPGLVLLGVLASAAWVHMFWGGPDTMRNIWFIP